MSVYIKGMEMPTEGTVIAIYKLNGKFYASVHGTELCPLIPVPKHGRLIDADALVQLFKEKAAEHGGIGGMMVALAAACIDAAPTIIPAEECK